MKDEAPGTAWFRGPEVVAGARYARVCRLPVPVELPVEGRAA